VVEGGKKRERDFVRVLGGAQYKAALVIIISTYMNQCKMPQLLISLTFTRIKN
jgi:hypothetical protein